MYVPSFEPFTQDGVTWRDARGLTDTSQDNEYLAAARAVAFGNPMGGPIQQAAEQGGAVLEEYISKYLLARDRLVSLYSWAIPSPVALEVVARYAPLVEIGAGVAYWAHLLRERGVDILAYDCELTTTPDHQNTYHRNELAVGTAWTEILWGNTATAGEHPDRTLFLCWPEYGTPMAWSALSFYQEAGGRTLVYIGEGRGGATGSDRFFDDLERDWLLREVVVLHRWRGISDHLMVYQRRETSV
jgi:hypothetical protein